MSADEPGRVSYTVKELLARMEGKIDTTNDRLGRMEHVIANAATVDALASATSRISLLEQQVVRREGPIIQEIRAFEKKVDQIATMALTKESISEALREEADRIIKHREVVDAKAVSQRQIRLGIAAIVVSIVISLLSILAAHPAILFAALIAL